MPRRAAALFAAAVAVGVVLAGCDGEETPTPTPTPSQTAASSSPSATPTTTSAAPSPSPSSEVPEAARQQTDAGAEAFVKYFVEQSALAWTVPDADLILRLSDPECESCSSLADTAKGLEKDGNRYAEEPISVQSVEALAGDGSRQNVAASITQFNVDVVDESGSIVSTDRADSLERTFLLYWKEGRWVVGGIA